LNSNSIEKCCVCGKEMDEVSGYSLPMYEGVVVPDDYEGDWAGFECCYECYQKHEFNQTELGQYLQSVNV